MNHKLTADRLRELLTYDPETGVFTWRNARIGSRAKAGTPAGGVKEDGYLRICLDGKHYYANRLAWLYVKGVWPAAQTDHVNRVRSDNRFSNLREATSSQNCQNIARPSHNTSGHKGVSRDRSKWRAVIRHQRQLIHLGVFSNIDDAVKAYAAGAAKYHTHNPTALTA